MKFTAEINVMPLKELLDPQGKAVMSGLKNLGINEAIDMRIGKHMTMQLEATNENEANEKVTLACKKLLCNAVMEYFEFTLSEVK
mgnify:CR=1 FL=1